jgi:hypothetical protein
VGRQTASIGFKLTSNGGRIAAEKMSFFGISMLFMDNHSRHRTETGNNHRKQIRKGARVLAGCAPLFGKDWQGSI